MQNRIQANDYQLIVKLIKGIKLAYGKMVLAIVFVFLSLGLKAQDVDSLRAKILQCFNESKFVEVIDYTEQALQLYEQADDKYNMAGCYNTIAGAYMRRGR